MSGDGTDGAGRADAWTQDGADAGNTGRTDEGPDGPVSVEWALDDHGDYDFVRTEDGGMDPGWPPAFVGGGDHLYTTVELIPDYADHDLDYTPRYVAAVDADSGDVAWRTELDEWDLDRVPAVGGGRLFAPVHDDVLAYDADTGEHRWTARLPAANGLAPDQESGAVGSHPTYADGRLFVGSRFGGVVAFEADTGEVAWRGETGAAVEATPAVADGTAFVRDADYDLHAFDAGTGDREWANPDLLEPFSEYIPDTRAAPVAADGTLYVSHQLVVHAVDPETGDPDWTFSPDDLAGYFETASVADGTVFATTTEGECFAVDADTGAAEWRHEADGENSPPAAVDGDAVYYTTEDYGDATLVALDADSGAERWTAHLGEVVQTVVAGGSVYALDEREGLKEFAE